MTEQMLNEIVSSVVYALKMEGSKGITEGSLFDLMYRHENIYQIVMSKRSSKRKATTPDKTVETVQCNFQCRAMQPSCPEGTNSPPSPPLVQCCFGLTAQACISCVTANNIAMGEGEKNLLICDSKDFCGGEWQK